MATHAGILSALLIRTGSWDEMVVMVIVVLKDTLAQQQKVFALAL